MQFHQTRLPNGLQIIGETIPSARAVAIGFWVRTGARDETPEISGVTHFLEHMIFKGSERRDAFAVNRDLDRIGASPNAFTSEENTVFHSVVLPEYMPQAVDVLSDILRPSLRVEDFEMEKKVIIEEIGRYDDQPGWVAYEKARELFYGGHPLGSSVLGKKEGIQALQRDQMYEYFRRRYVAPNITVAVAGNYAWPDLVRLVEKHCGQWETGPIGRKQICEVAGTDGFSVITQAATKQEYIFFVAPGPCADSTLRHSASVLAVIVGDDANSRLYWELVDPGHAESAGCGVDNNEGAGAYFTSCSGEPEETEANLERVHRVLADVQRDGVTEDELRLAKTKIQSHLVRSSERSYRRMLDLGSSWTYLGRYRSLDEELADFDAVNRKSVREVLDRYPLTKLTTVTLGPLTEVRRPS